MLGLLAEVVPDAELVDEERLTADEVSRRADEDPDGGAFDLEAFEPSERAELEAQLEEMMVRHEDAWIDSELPALDGATPRQAADDPTRRPALLRLLDDLEARTAQWDSPGRPMDADRLRRLLGLS